MGKGKKKHAKNKEKELDGDEEQQMAPVEQAVPPETITNDGTQTASSLVIVEVFEARKDNKLSAGQQVVTVFDGEDMYQVVTDEPVHQDDLVAYAKPGCVIPGTQQQVGTRKVNGVKSQGHICNAYEVGWQETPTQEYLCIDEDWNMISGDVCPMGPPQGWVQSHAASIASNQVVESAPESGGRASKTGASGQGKVGHHGRDVSPGQVGESEHAADDSDDAPNERSKLKGIGANAFVGLMGSGSSESDLEEDMPKKPSKGVNVFAGLMGSEEDDDEDDGKYQPPKISGANAKAANAFAGLLGSDESDESEDDTEEQAPRHAASSRSGAGPSKAVNAFAGLIDSDNAEDSDVGQGEDKLSAPAGAKAASTLAGLVEASGEDEAIDPGNEADIPVGPSNTSSASGAFTALLDDSEHSDDGEIATSVDKKQVSHVTNDVSNDAEEGQTRDQFSLLEMPIENLTTTAKVQEAMQAEGVSKTRKQKLKQRLKKLQEAAVAAHSVTETEKDPATTPVDDLDTVEQVESAMNAPGVSKTRKQKLKQRLKALQEAPEDIAAGSHGVGSGGKDVPVDSLLTVEEVQAALDDPKISKTRKQKLKQRLKQLEDSASKTKGKKVSAAVAAMQRELEERRKAEDAARKAQEEKQRAEEEARLQEELEAKRREEAEEARAEAKRLEREKLRREGKLLTTKQRAKAKRLAAQREVFLARAQEVGITTGDTPTPAQLEERRRQAKKRQKELEEQRAREKEAAEQAERERKRQAEKEAEMQRRKDAEAAAAALTDAVKAAGRETAADNWEDEVPDEWDASDGHSDDVAAQGQEPGNDSGISQIEEAGTGSSSEDDSSEGDSSEEDSSSEFSTDSEEERERRLEEARARREARFKEAMGHRSKDDLRSPICCILGHVDTGKTKILDNIRRTNVQTGEAGGITQQIGATYIPADAVQGRTEELRKGKEFDMKMPGLLVIDTPGHESFSNLRSRGSSLCDIAVLVVDIMHGLEQQTIESINLLKMRKSPFIIALNKIDRMYNWQAHENAPVRDSLSKQEKATQEEFDTRCRDSMLALNEQGLNVELYWKNKDPRRFVNIVPTSAITGEGVCDLMWLIVKLTQNMMMDRLMFVEELQCTVLEVKVVEGYGHTIDAVLINGRIREGDKVVICGLQGPIVTTVRSLLTPHPLKELRVKNTYIHHKEIKAAQGIKMSAPNLENAVAGTQLFVIGKEDDEDELKDLVMEDMSDIFDKKEPEGVCVQASTLGSLEALLEFLSSDAVQIPVSGLNIGPVHKKDIMRANIMNEKKLKKYSCILAFDVPITREAQALAQNLGVTVFAADIIYHLFDMFTEYTQRCKAEEKSAAATKAVFPCRMRIVPNCIFNAKDPIVLGCEVIEGQLRMGTPITVAAKDCDLGKVIGLEKDHKAVDVVDRGDSAAVKIEATNSVEASKLVGRHFVESDELVSKISRESIDALKAHFRDEMTRPLWELVIKLKKVFKID